MAKYDPPIRGFWKTSDVDAVSDPLVLKVLASSYSLVGPVGTRAGQRLWAWVKKATDPSALRKIAERNVDPEGHRQFSCVDYQPYWSVYGGNTAFAVMRIGDLAQNRIQEMEEQEATRLREEQEAAHLREEAEQQRNAELEAKRPRIRYLLGEAALLAKKKNVDKALDAVAEAERLGAAEDPEMGSQLREMEVMIGSLPVLKKGVPLSCKPLKIVDGSGMVFTGNLMGHPPIQRYTLIDSRRLRVQTEGSRQDLFSVAENDEDTLVATYMERLYGQLDYSRVTISKKSKTATSYHHTKQSDGYPDLEYTLFLDCN
jgi:hypothetical protein